MSDLKFRIKAQRASDAKTIVKARNFEIIVDEPQSLGGTDLAPNPVEYVLAALAGCLNVTGSLIAKEMGFELRDLQIEISGNLNPARLFGKTDVERAGYNSVEVKMIPDSDADEVTLNEWLRKVESRCPVSDNIMNSTPVKVGLKLLQVA
ncbi:MAG: OsmC family protein [Bacteroidales bacterium]|nr:OsmC family protein [Bacteroidales bacterium]MDD3892134.1 OsmC family protein [Bacteroidales bacterium]